MTLDEWAARECGVELDHNYFIVKNRPEALDRYEKWTLNDARCREIVREHFWIETYRVRLIDKDEFWESRVTPYKTNSIGGRGDSIAEAEIACIEAIRRASDEENS